MRRQQWGLPRCRRVRATARRLRESVDRPPVTDNERLCARCSLAPVCLPEETLYEIGVRGEGPPAAGLTRVIPQSDDGAVLYLQEPGSHVGKRSEHLIVRKDGAALARCSNSSDTAAG